MDVVNVKVKYIRKTGYDNLKVWMEDDQNEYIGRKGIVFIEGKRYPDKASIWANPYKVGKHGDIDEVLEKYEKYITEKIQNDDNYDIETIRNKNLGCWCKPCKCHGDILQKILNSK